MRNALTRFVAVVLALACAGYTALAQNPSVAEVINKQADDVSMKDWKALSMQGQPLARMHDIADVMNLMKIRKNGGVGVGRVPGAVQPDGIEARIIRLSRSPMAPVTLGKEQTELIRMAEHLAAIASVSVHQCNVAQPKGAKNPARWKEWMEELHKASLDMIMAAKDKKPENLQDAAKRAYRTCTECHKTFRDDT